MRTIGYGMMTNYATISGDVIIAVPGAHFFPVATGLFSNFGLASGGAEAATVTNAGTILGFVSGGTLVSNSGIIGPLSNDRASGVAAKTITNYGTIANAYGPPRDNNVELRRDGPIGRNHRANYLRHYRGVGRRASSADPWLLGNRATPSVEIRRRESMRQRQVRAWGPPQPSLRSEAAISPEAPEAARRSCSSASVNSRDLIDGVVAVAARARKCAACRWW